MKYFLYRILAFVFIFNTGIIYAKTTNFNSESKSLAEGSGLSADFSFPNTICSETPVQFTSNIADSSIYSYYWEFGDGETSTEKNPIHTYSSTGCATEDFSVSLTVTDTTSASVTKSNTITVQQQPEIDFWDSENPYSQFDNCDSASVNNPDFTIKVEKYLASSCITSYTIDWGDGSSSETATNSSFPVEHTYQKLGLFYLTITATGTNSCSTTVQKEVKNVTNPSVGLSTPGSTTNLCAPTEQIKFEINNWGGNSEGTTYNVNFGDGTEELVLSQEDMNASIYYNSAAPDSSSPYPIYHSYTKSSCAYTAGKFEVTVTASNSCDYSEATVGPVTVLSSPTADFDASDGCLNADITFSNTTIHGYGKNCDKEATIFYWDFGDGTTMTLPKKIDVTHAYTAPGKYAVTLISSNYCGGDSITKEITIHSLPTATIQKDTAVCQDDPSPVLVLTGSVGTPPYTFTYTINNGASQTIQTNNSDSMVTLSVPTNTPGTFVYRLTNVEEGSQYQCSQNISEEATVIVAPLPEAEIKGTATACLNDPSPTITFTGSVGTPPYTFTYNINGGPDQTVSTTTGSSATISAPTNVGGDFIYRLTKVTDSGPGTCSTSMLDSVIITIFDEIPDVDPVNDFEYCNNDITDTIIFTGTLPGTVFEWINSNTSIGLDSTSGTNTIPSFTTTNTTNGPISSEIIVTPSTSSCTGESDTFTITVNPSVELSASIPNQTICSEETTNKVTLTCPANGAVISWSVVKPAGILENISTTGNNIIPAQVLTNTTDSPIVLTYKCSAVYTGATSCRDSVMEYSITVNSKPSIGNLSDTICSGNSFNIVPQNNNGNIIPTGTKYIWNTPSASPSGAVSGGTSQSSQQTSISQTLINLTDSIVQVTYTVTPLTSECQGQPFSVFVYVVPDAPVISPNDIELCNGETCPVIVFEPKSGHTIYEWKTNNQNIGLTCTSGSDSIPEFIATNTGTVPQTAQITVTPTNKLGNTSCTGNSAQFTITVNPTGQVNNPGNFSLCYGDSLGINFTTSNKNGNTLFEWQNNNPEIGLAASGTGAISFIEDNTTDSIITATITVTPIYKGNGVNCPGNPEQFTITASPRFSMNQPDDQSVCNGRETEEIVFTGSSNDIIYNWQNNAPSIGLAAGGTGNIPSFTAINNQSDSVVATITVIPQINGCPGDEKKFTITVKASAVITKQPSSRTVCLGEKPVALTVLHTSGLTPPEYQWYSNTTNSNTGGTLLQGENSNVFEPPYASATKKYYYCIITFAEGGCNTLISDVATVTIFPNPEVFLNDGAISRGEELKFCQGDSILIYLSGAESYIWKAGASDKETNINDSIFISTEGQFRIIGTSIEGCTDTFNFSASYYENFNYIINSNKTEISNDDNQVHFWTDAIKNSYYTWYFGDGKTGYGQELSHTFSIENDGYFDVTLEVENPYGCIEKTTKRIFSNMGTSPNTFSPNNDGINDIYMPGWQIEIYNRNGILIYEGNEGWDGNYKGKPVASDTYFVIIYDSTEKGASYKTNYVTVLK